VAGRFLKFEGLRIERVFFFLLVERGFTQIANVGGKALRVFFDWWSGV